MPIGIYRAANLAATISGIFALTSGQSVIELTRGIVERTFAKGAVSLFGTICRLRRV
jgi:hypothetical protein